jgi:CheY-like chemotaxis protein
MVDPIRFLKSEVRWNEMKDKRVLLVEDNPGLRQEYQEIISSAGYAVDSRHNLQDAIKTIRNNSYHVAVIDIRLDEDDGHNQDGFSVLEYLHGLGEGTEAIVLSAQEDMEVTIDAYEKYEIAQYLEKRKNKRPSDITSAVDRAYERCKLREYGSYSSLTSLLSGEKNPTHWEYSCLSLLHPRGGIKGLHSFLSDLCKPYSPLLPKKGKKPPMQLDPSNQTLTGEFWSKGIGQEILLTASPKDTGGEQSKALHTNEADEKELHFTFVKAGVFGAAFTKARGNREDFLERV